MSENDRLLQDIADEANHAVDFDALRASILAENTKRRARQRGSFIRYASAAAVFVFVVGGAAIFLSRSGMKSQAPASPMMMAASDSAGTEEAAMYDMAVEDTASNEVSCETSAAPEAAPAEAAPAEGAPALGAGSGERGTEDNGGLLLAGGFSGEYAPREGETELSWNGSALFTLDFGKEYLVSENEYCFMLTVTEATLENFDSVCEALADGATEGSSYVSDDEGGAVFTCDLDTMKIDMTLSGGTLSLTIYAK